MLFLTCKHKYGLDDFSFTNFLIYMQNIGTLAIEEWLSVIKNTFKHIPYGLKNEQELSKLFSKITQEELYLSLIYYF